MTMLRRKFLSQACLYRLYRTIASSCLMVAVTAGLGSQAMAQAYPVKPVKVVVGYGAGGAVDIVARTVGQSMAANMALYQPAPFDAERDLVPVSLVGRVPVVIAANPAVPYLSIAKMIEAAKGKPESIAYATPGNGSTPHMAIELFARAASMTLQHIPYRGGVQAITDTIGGQVPLVAVNALEALPHVKSGKLKILAVLSATRSSVFPDAPTIAESGFPGFEASVWYGFVAPAATPKPVVARLHAEVQKALQTREVRERMTGVGGEVSPGTAEQFGALIHSERLRYEKLVHVTGIKPD